MTVVRVVTHATCKWCKHRRDPKEMRGSDTCDDCAKDWFDDYLFEDHITDLGYDEWTVNAYTEEGAAAFVAEHHWVPAGRGSVPSRMWDFATPSVVGFRR